MLLLQIQLSPFQAGLLLGAGLGFVLGLIPLILGIIKKKTKIGILGFVGSIIGNTILGLLLSGPIVGVCIYLILKKETPDNISDSKVSAAADSEIS